MRHSLYWDDFEKRAEETLSCHKNNATIPVRRVAVFITDKCNLKCAYCNSRTDKRQMDERTFDSIVERYGDTAIIHITGGEPSMVPWLYEYLLMNGDRYSFHLNTNAVVTPPASSVKRLKVSLDSCNSVYWNRLVGAPVFGHVVKNIKEAIPKTVVSITYTITRENYLDIPEFIDFANKEFKGVYAIFFSVYKGRDDRFAFTDKDMVVFFETIKPQMDKSLDDESRSLLNETITEKFRIMQGTRFPENDKQNICYLALSERVFGPSGEISGCSHLYRDGIFIKPGMMDDMCKYGCNRRLVAFNEYVSRRIEASTNKEVV